MRLTKQVLQEKYSAEAISSAVNHSQHEIEELQASKQESEQLPRQTMPQLSIDFGLGKLTLVLVMGVFMLVGPAVLYENREEVVTAVAGQLTQSSGSTQAPIQTQTAQANEIGRVAGLSDQAGTQTGQVLSTVFFILGALLLTVPVFIVLRL